MSKKNYALLVQNQLDRLKQGNGNVEDMNPEGYLGRTYDELRRIKYPLILDYEAIDTPTGRIVQKVNPPRKPWTIEEVLEAMRPSIRALSIEYGGKRPGFMREDAECTGLTAVLDALWTDKGLAWFAGYCYERIETAINRVSKTSGIIRAPEHAKQWRDNVRYTEDTVGEGDATVGEFIGSDLAIPTKVPCGDYKNGKLINPTCKKGKIGDQKCDRCKGTGFIIIHQPKLVPGISSKMEQSERAEKARRVWEAFKQVLTPVQLEMVELLYGMDGTNERRTFPEASKLYMERHGMGCKNRVKQAVVAAQKKIVDLQARNPDLTNEIDEIIGEIPDDWIIDPWGKE